MQQHTIRRHSWALEPINILLGPFRNLVGPKYRSHTGLFIKIYISAHMCPLGLPDFGKSFKTIVEPAFSHEFDHAEFNGAQKIRSRNI